MNSGELAILVTALSGLVAAIATLVGVILTHGKVGKVEATVQDAAGKVEAVKQIVTNGGPTSPGASSGGPGGGA